MFSPLPARDKRRRAGRDGLSVVEVRPTALNPAAHGTAAAGRPVVSGTVYPNAEPVNESMPQRGLSARRQAPPRGGGSSGGGLAQRQVSSSALSPLRPNDCDHLAG